MRENFGYGISVFKVNGLIDMSNEVRGHRWSALVLQESYSSARHQHRPNLDLEIVIEFVAVASLEETDAVPTRPHMSGDIAEELIIRLSVRSEMHPKTVLT